MLGMRRGGGGGGSGPALSGTRVCVTIVVLQIALTLFLLNVGAVNRMRNAFGGRGAWRGGGAALTLDRVRRLAALPEDGAAAGAGGSSSSGGGGGEAPAPAVPAPAPAPAARVIEPAPPKPAPPAPAPAAAGDGPQLSPLPPPRMTGGKKPAAVQPAAARLPSPYGFTPRYPRPPPEPAPEEHAPAGPLKRAEAGASAGSTSSGRVAPPALPIPALCYTELGFHYLDEVNCYRDTQAQFAEAVAADPFRPLCWGYSSAAARDAGLATGPPASDPASPPRYVIHTIALTGLLPQVRLFFASFLATQCCDTQLWVWVAQPDTRLDLGPELNAAAEGRIIYRPLDVFAEWRGIAADFPDVPDANVTAMLGFKDIRYTSDFIRQILMYRWGGMYVDIDTVLLRDLRDFCDIPEPWAYRQGHYIQPNNAAIKITPRHPTSLALLKAEFVRGDPKPDGMLDILGWRIGESEHMHLFSAYTFDALWSLWLDADQNRDIPEAERKRELGAVHPDLRSASGWDEVFRPLNAERKAEAEALEFFPGSFSYHWHNRYERNIPENSWAEIIWLRMKGIALKKMPVCRG